MDRKLKYVKLKNGEVIIFPQIIEHKTFKQLEPITAGFCYIEGDREKVSCFGESYSLNLKSDEKQDTLDATKQVFGIDAMLKLM